MSVANLGDLVATAQLDISPFMNNTRQLQMYMRGLDNSLKTVENSFKGQKSKLDGMKAVYNQTGTSLKGYQALLDKQTATYNNLKAEIGDVNNATSEQKGYLIGSQSAMTATAAKVAELQAKYNALTRDIAVQSSAWTNVGNVLTPMGQKMKAFGEGMAGVGQSLTTGLTLPIVAGAGYALKAAVQYESAFAGVRKTVDETATMSYEKLSSGIRDMSKQLPATAVQIAKVAEVSGQLGISADNVLGFTKVMIDMGESTNLTAEDAATAIAKIANITGMSAEQYQRFGSSVVALGNNFATTESDILRMANRLASAGTIAGLTNQEILGLATAMSSVGIEAEMGGSAMSQTLAAIEKAVATGSDKLQGFAEIAGMTADQFTEKWHSSPAEALQSFITGLGQLDEKGESATLTLGELGLSGIRQSNMLKSLGLAAGTMTSAIEMSNKAWDENKALTNEANKRYETTESKLKMLRNEVTDVAIEFGGPLVDALRDGLEASKPFIQGAVDLAKAFSKLDKEQQQQIITWGLIAASAGPALTIFGKATGVIGSVFNGLGKMSTFFGRISGGFQALKDGVPAIQAFTTGTTAATAASTGWAGAIGLLGNPVTWGVLLGGAALVAIGYFAQKAAEARQRTEEWGTAVSKAEAQELSRFKEKVDETTKAMDTFGTEGVEDVEAVKTAFSELTDEINKLVDENLSKDLELAKKLGLSDEEIQRIKDNADETKATVEGMSEEVVSIYKNANEQRRQLSEEEKQIVLSAQTALIQEQLEQLKYSGKEKEAITKAMNGQIDELNGAQLAKALSTTKKWIESENKEYKSRKNGIEQLFKEGKMSQETYHREVEQLEAEHAMKMDTYGEKYNAIRKKMAGNVKLGTPEAEASYWGVIQKEMDKLGLSYDELQQKMAGLSETASKSSSLVGQYWQGMSEEAQSAVTYWNSLVLDPKTGEVKTNAQEEIQKALQAEGGWEAMQLSLKEGRMTTTAKIAVGEALQANGQWESLSPSEKRLVTDSKPAIEAILSSKDMLAQWNALPEEVKQILGNNESFIFSSDAAKSALNAWNLMTPTQKALTAQNLTGPDVNLAQQTVNSLVGKNVSLDAKNNTLASVLQATANVNSVPNKHVTISAQDNASGIAASVRGSLSLIPQRITTVIETIRQSITRNATGTNFHPGGLAMVNDQKGPMYRELVTLPTGESFIPQGRDAVLDLPRGSKVLKASDTRKLFPHYANGIGFENTGIANLARRIGQISTGPTIDIVTSDNSNLQPLLSMLIDLTREGNSITAKIIEAILDLTIDIDGEPVAKMVTNYQQKRDSVLKAIYGGGW